MLFCKWVWIMFSAFSIVTGCTNNEITKSYTDPIMQYHQQIGDKQFYEAFLSYISIRSALEQRDEDVSGFEYQRLLGTTAGIGQKDWARILDSPLIPLDIKLDLVKEIDETCRLP